MDHCAQGAASGSEEKVQSPGSVSHEGKPSSPKSDSSSEGSESSSVSSGSEQHSGDSVDGSGTETESLSELYPYIPYRRDAAICEGFRTYGYCHDRECRLRHIERRRIHEVIPMRFCYLGICLGKICGCNARDKGSASNQSYNACLAAESGVPDPEFMCTDPSASFKEAFYGSETQEQLSEAEEQWSVADEQSSEAEEHSSEAEEQWSEPEEQRREAQEHRSEAEEHRSEAQKHRSGAETQRREAEEHSSEAEEHRSEVEEQRTEAEKHSSEAEEHSSEAEEQWSEAEEHSSEAEDHGSEAEEQWSEAEEQGREAWEHRNQAHEERAEAQERRGVHRAPEWIHRRTEPDENFWFPSPRPAYDMGFMRHYMPRFDLGFPYANSFFPLPDWGWGWMKPVPDQFLHQPHQSLEQNMASAYAYAQQRARREQMGLRERWREEHGAPAEE